MHHPLPRLTADVDLVLEDLQKFGYGLLSDCLVGERLRRTRGELLELARKERANGRSIMDGGGANQRIWQLVNRSSTFRELVTDARVLDLLGRTLGTHPDYSKPGGGNRNFLLSNLTANIAGPGGEQMELHADQYFVPPPWPDYPLVSNVIWALDEFTAENGATRVVPRTHVVPAPAQPDAEAAALPVEVPAGSAIVLDGRVLHGAGANIGACPRHALLAFYCRPWLRQQENYAVSASPAVVGQALPVLRELLGLEVYRNLGHFSDPA